MGILDIPPLATAKQGLGGVYARRPYVWADFTDKPDGTPIKLDSGQSWQILGSATPMSIQSGALTVVKPASGGWAGYANVYLTKDCDSMGAEFDFSTATGSNGALTLVIWSANPYVQGSTGTKCHLVITRSAWAYWVRDGVGGTLTQIATGTFTTALSMAVRYSVSIAFSGNTAYILLPDGSTTTVQHSLIASLGAKTPCIEPYAASDNTAELARVYRMWADIPGGGGSGAGAALVTQIKAFRTNTTPASAITTITVRASEMSGSTYPGGVASSAPTLGMQPTSGTFGRVPVMLLQKAADTGHIPMAVTVVRFPTDWNVYSVDLIWASASGTGAARLALRTMPILNGSTMPTASGDGTTAVTQQVGANFTAQAQDTFTKTTLYASIAVPRGDDGLVLVELPRFGYNAGDTCSGAIGIVALVFNKVS